MKIACIGDIHLINPNDPRRDLVEQRSFFIDGQASLRRLFAQLHNSGVELVVFLGDLVDWASIENIEYAAKFLQQLQVPWVAVPGNHDYANPDTKDDPDLLNGRDLVSLWAEHDVDFSSRSIDCGEFSLLLLDNSLGTIEAAALDWLDAELNKKPFNLLCQHLPLDLPLVRACIHELAPNRNLDHYTCSAHAGIYASHLQGRVQAVASGHVHVSASLMHEQCALHLCNVGIDLDDPGRGETAVSSVTILTFDGQGFQAEIVTAG